MVGCSSHVSFGIDSAELIQQEAHLHVVAKNLYNQDANRTPVTYGVLDRRMGVSQKDATCDTCKKGLNDCVGHFGYIDLALPVFHVGHFRATITILQSICKVCSRVMLKEDEKKQFSARLMNPNLSYLAKKSIHSQVLKKAKKNTKCPYCGSLNGPVKKGAGLMKIVHEPFRGKKATDPLVTNALEVMMGAIEGNRELSQTIGPSSLMKELNPVEVLDLFKNIPKSDIPLLGMTSPESNPADLIVTRVFVPPVCIRPSVVSEVKAGTTEDDLTMKQSEILLISDVIAKHMMSGGKIELIQEDWDYLQLHCALYFNSELSGIPLSLMVRFEENLLCITTTNLLPF